MEAHTQNKQERNIHARLYISREEEQKYKSILSDRTNFSLLEETLYYESQRITKLQREPSSLDFSQSIKKDDVSLLFKEVKNRVDEFLETDYIGNPELEFRKLDWRAKLMYSIGLFGICAVSLKSAIDPSFTKEIMWGLYSVALSSLTFGSLIHWKGQDEAYQRDYTIGLWQKNRVKAITALGHEYMHIIQSITSKKMNQTYPDGPSPLTDGPARYIERVLAFEFQEKEDNSAFLYDVFDRSFGELKSVYSWLCGDIKKPKNEFIKTKTSVDKVEKKCRKKFGFPTPHAIGNALCYIIEQKMSANNFKKMIQKQPTLIL